MMRYSEKWQRLGIFEEAVGTMDDVAGEDGFLIAKIGGLEIILPLELENKLQPLIGNRIGVLRTDIPGKEYLVRTISEPGMKSALKADNPQQLAQGSA
jgi:hypothetical protein